MKAAPDVLAVRAVLLLIARRGEPVNATKFFSRTQVDVPAAPGLPRCQKRVEVNREWCEDQAVEMRSDPLAHSIAIVGQSSMGGWTRIIPLACTGTESRANRVASPTKLS